MPTLELVVQQEKYLKEKEKLQQLAKQQGVVPPGHWQAAESRGAWTLVGCTVAPAFRFEGFELAPPDWAPGRGD